MELVAPSATTQPPMTTQTATPDTPVTDGVVPVRLMRTALLGLLGSAAVVGGSLMGGSSFETHLPGAWFFGMPGGTLGWIGSNGSLPTISSLALVFGGLILLTRVWLGLLRYLRQHE